MRYVLLSLLLFVVGCRAQGQQTAAPALPPTARLLWMDATANFERLGTHEGIDRVLDRTVEAGFTDVVVDIKPLSGETLYASEYAPRLTTFDGFTRPDDYDFVDYILRAGRERGLRVHLALNVFGQGHKYFETGPVYGDHPEWQTVILDEDGALRPTTEIDRGYTAFANPAREDVRANELAIYREVARRFDPDGIVLDRGRYDNVYSDFSDESRALFEGHLGRPVENWPGDILRRTDDPERPEHGPLFGEWIKWRASVIESFFEQARAAIEEVDPAILFGDYVGAWYPIYYQLGVNWASEAYDPADDYEWATPDYHEYAYAEELDFLMTGNYYVEVTPEDLRQAKERATKLDTGMDPDRDTSYTVESSIRLVERLVGDATLTYPSLYVEQYEQAGQPEQFERALRAALRMKGGLMIFDVVHLERDSLWGVVEDAFADFPPSGTYPY